MSETPRKRRKTAAHTAAQGAGFIAQKLLLLFVIIISVWPVAWVFLASLKTNREILDASMSPPANISFDAYVNAVAQSDYLIYFFNSAFVSVMSVLLSVLIFGMSGYVLARFQFPGRRIITTLFVATLLVSLIPMQQPILVVTQTVGLYDSLWALVLVNVGKALPIVTFVMMSFVRSVPVEIEEAARIDGAGFFRTYFLIVLPIMRPAIASSGVLVFLNSWNEFLFPLLLTKSADNITLPLALRSYENMFSYDFPVLFAAVIMTIAPSILIYVLLQDQIQQSLAAGAVKG